VASLLWFLGCLAGLVLLGLLVKKLTGAKTYLVESFPLEPGEHVLWQDDAADVHSIPTRQAAFVSYRRARRSLVKVTNLRVVCGSKGLFGGGHIVQHVLYPSDRTIPDPARALGGGLLTVGYQALVFRRSSLERHVEKAPHFIELVLDPSFDSSVNLRAYRVYSEQTASFVLPE